MRILLTGHNGFVGKALKSHLESKGHEVVGYDLPKQDILDEMELYLYAQKEIDVVIHNAAIADLNDTWKNMNQTFDTNIRGTYNVSAVCSALGIRMIYISTCCVYGNTKHLLEEEDETIPMTIEPYACSKMAGEYVVRGMPDINYTILRIGTVYGKDMRPALFNWIALDSVENKKEITVNGNGFQTRQYIYIDDLVDGIGRACEFGIDNRETINLCGMEQTTVLDTIRIAEKITGKKALVKWDMYGRYGEIDVENISTDKAFKLLNWMPKTRYADGMKKVYERHFNS